MAIYTYTPITIFINSTTGATVKIVLFAYEISWLFSKLDLIKMTMATGATMIKKLARMKLVKVFLLAKVMLKLNNVNVYTR